MTARKRFLVFGLSLAATCLPPYSISLAAEGLEPVGTVTGVKVYAYGTPPGAARAPKFAHTDLYRNELIETVRDGGLEAKFADGTRLILSGSSSLVIDEYVYDPKGTNGQNAIYNLAQGAFFYATGSMNKDAIELTTPVATIGIRGTELVIEVGPDGATKIGVVSGAARVTSLRDRTSWDAERGHSVSIDREGGVSDVKTGIDPTGVEAIDNEIPGDLEKPEKKDDYENLREEEDRKNRKDAEGEDGRKGRADGEGEDGKDRKDRGDSFGADGFGDGTEGGGKDEGDRDRDFFSDGIGDSGEEGFDDGPKREDGVEGSTEGSTEGSAEGSAESDSAAGDSEGAAGGGESSGGSGGESSREGRSSSRDGGDSHD